MATLIIDTHNFITRLTAAGMEDKQAEAIVEGLKEIDLKNVASKEDIINLEHKIEKLELSMTIKTAVIVAAVIGFFRVIEAFF